MPHNLLAFDFDGTVSDIVEDYRAAQLHPECRTMLQVLADKPDSSTAILSSRTLKDLLPRIDVPNIIIGGSNGGEWLFPDGRLIDLVSRNEVQLCAARREVLAELRLAASIEGFRIEDKRVSLAVHVRQVPQRYRHFVRDLMNFLKMYLRSDIAVYEGREAYEIIFLTEYQKPTGFASLCRLLDFDRNTGFMLYAGDDAHDREVMKSVVGNGGTAFTVGPEPLIPGSATVAGPRALAGAVLKLIA